MAKYNVVLNFDHLRISFSASNTLLMCKIGIKYEYASWAVCTDACVFRKWPGCALTVSGHNYSPPLENSIDLHVFSYLQEKIFCLSWSTHFYVFGVI